MMLLILFDSHLIEVQQTHTVGLNAGEQGCQVDRMKEPRYLLTVETPKYKKQTLTSNL